MSKCYFCSASATSAEHVPPKALFSAGTQRITVPSCDAHNTSRSLDDEYFRMVLCGIAWDKVPIDVKEKVKRSAARGRGPAVRILKNTYKSPAATHGNYDIETQRFEICAESIARALIFHSHQIRHDPARRPELLFHFVECTFDAPPDVLARYAMLKAMAEDYLKELPYETYLAPTMVYKTTPTSAQFNIYQSCKVTALF